MKKNTRRGHFIVIEGTDGSGKGTQTKILRKLLQMVDYPHEVVSFPRYGNNPYAKLLSKYLQGDLGKMDNEAGTYLLSLAYAGDRSLSKPLIEEWLKEGKLVVADRYVPSNKAFMAAKLPSEQRKSFIEWLDDLEYNINRIPREELVILLYLPPEKCQELIGKKEPRDYLKGKSHDIHEGNLDFLKETAKLYLELAKQEPNWVVIDCLKKGELKTPDEIHLEILNILKDKRIIKI